MTIDISVQNNNATPATGTASVGWKQDETSSSTQPACNPGWNDYTIQNLGGGAFDNRNGIGTTAPSTPGTYYVGAFVDSTCQITESQEGTTGVTINGDNYGKSAAYTVASAPPPPPPECSDGSDNDGDGKIDFPTDPGCTDTADTSETDPSPVFLCSDTVDNDSDGKVDFPADPGCSSATDNDENDTVPGGGTDPLPPDATLPPAQTVFPTAEYNCDGLTESVYCYIVSADRSYYLLWVRLDNLKDPLSIYMGGTHCRYLPPEGTNFNFCLEAQK